MYAKSRCRIRPLTRKTQTQKCLDSLQGKGFKECIVVGIDHGGTKRINEYNPYDHFQYGKGMGNEYLQFIAETLKPYRDWEQIGRAHV